MAATPPTIDETDCRRLVERDDIDLVGVCVPNHLHRDVGVAALRAGKAVATKHLADSRAVFLRLLDVSRGLSEARIASMIADRDNEEPDRSILDALVGARADRTSAKEDR